MRTAIIILAGLVLGALCFGVARVMTGGRPSAMTTATAVFVIIWLICAATNMWIGVTRAGYSVAEELPIFLVIFLVPAIVAVVVRWRLFH
jgi:hypothetical protein